MDALTNIVTHVGDFIWQGMFVVLIGIGLYLTIRTRGVQFRSISEMFRVLGEPSGKDSSGRNQISSFRAFTISAASRVGTANIAGVALAISIGGPGAVFWMWVIASLGAASAFVESLLAQLYKHPGKESYVGGPAYYMERGLRARWMGVAFAVIICLTYGFVFNTVQSNSIVDAISQSTKSFAPDLAEGSGLKVIIGVVLAVITALIIFGGIRSISSVTQVLVPVMAVMYVGLGLIVVVMNLNLVPEMFVKIIQGAFGIKEFVSGGLMGVIIQGVRRGLFSNEAGMGSAPNAGATAAVSHPAKQGFVQSLGVYFDTLVVCSITAFIVLLSNPTFGDQAAGASLTQSALAAQLGGWAVHFLTVAIFLFAFSSVIGNYYYGESNIEFLTSKKWILQAYRVVVLLCVFGGAVVALDLVWSLADVFMAIMALLNLIAVFLLAGVANKVLKHYEAQRRERREPIFHASDLPEIRGLEAWKGDDEVTTREFWIDHEAMRAASRNRSRS
ncbi:MULTISPECIES: alanine/glycine:cation symporter family protein [Kocuria]|uniref:alanine/glycine:cation symporter family protein n=1 Tax=Kocuria TaxID=57493 RepID=UPI00065FB679|nr:MULTISPECIES: alanine/glycine:cation symporter family protein [Kocuria]MCT1367046.1 alanine:cation symporter family protein [Rothia sp. p3-SID1597]RUQ21751.1 alanine:cation symporter family protein [Kocuria sp. HSID16901]